MIRIQNYHKTITTLHILMIYFNLIIVIFYGGVYLLSTRYIIQNEMSRAFLDKLTYIPHHPLYVFFGSIILYGLLMLVMYYRRIHKNFRQQWNIIYSCLEVFLCFILIYLLYMGYNGLILLVFCDCILYMREDKSTRGMLVGLVVIYLLSNYDVFSSFMHMTDPDAYFEAFSVSLRSLLMISKNILETMNILIFITFIIFYIANQIEENENIAKELDMINQVNQELRNYAAITEKIGEDNERKRLAREIHDTLGHALTGIAAGVDACIAMIDIDPNATKKQLIVVSKVVRQGIGDVRNSLNKLRPGALEEHGFQGAIESMIEEFTSVSDLKIDFNYNLENVDFENTKEDVLFRAIQESITNSTRHGLATQIQIDIYQQDHILYLKIKDNGQGCEHITQGYGLKQMRERVGMINGEVYYDGSDGFLTVIKIPMQRGENCD